MRSDESTWEDIAQVGPRGKEHGVGGGVAESLPEVGGCSVHGPDGAGVVRRGREGGNVTEEQIG